MLSQEEVVHIARLSQLKLSKAEIKTLQKQLSEVVEYVSSLDEVDTKNTKPTSQTTGLLNVTRKDEPDPGKSLTQPQALSGAKKTHNNYFVVPLTLDKRTV